MGDNYGAVDDFFNRHEKLVYGLPPEGKIVVDEINFQYQNFHYGCMQLELITGKI